MALLSELPLKPGYILRYTDNVTHRTVCYRINQLGFFENYFLFGNVDSSLATIPASAMADDGWSIETSPQMPLKVSTTYLKNKKELDVIITTEITRDFVVDELTTPRLV